MPDPQRPPTPRPKDTADLIESIYRIALEPQTYDTFMGRWDDFIQTQIARLYDLQAGLGGPGDPLRDAEIENHFDIAMRLLEQAGRPDPQIGDPAHRSGVPQMMFSEDGRVIWHNSAARAAFDIATGRTLDDFALSPAHRRQLDEMLAGRGTAGVVIALMSGPGGGPKIPMSVQPSGISARERSFMATEVRQRWPRGTDALLESGFQLSAAEIDICAALADGRSSAEIAEARQSALATVRTQVKRILQKTGSATQVDLVSLLHATMRLAETNEPPRPPPARVPDSVVNVAVDGRTMPVETFGDPRGTPVVFCHGMLDGNAMTQTMRALLERHGFRLICPVRPNFGNAAPDPNGTIADAPQRFARDIEAMLDHMALDRVLLLGHMAGSLYAFAAAAHLGARAVGVLNVAGGVPIVSPVQFAAMSVRQRVVACTARYTPRVLPFVIRAGINQIDNRGELQFMHSLYENSPCDMRDARAPELREIIVAGYHFAIQQGHRAFEIDSYHVVRDWSALVAASDVPIALVHGREDPVVSIASVEAFAAGLGDRAQLTTLKDVGQLAFYHSPDTVIATLDALRAKTLPRARNAGGQSRESLR